jgi:MFS family permease
MAAIVLSARVMREARDPGEGAVPDPLGIVLVTAALGLIALGLVKAPEWGWGDRATIGALAAGIALVPLVIARSRRHPAPVLDVSLFRARSFAAANAGTVLFSTGFYAMLLAHVLFLTTVWGYDVLTAGAALTPGPLMAALSAGPAGRLADRYGQRAVAMPGALIYALGLLWFVTQVGAEPAYVADWLPGTIVTGIGVGLAFPTFGSAAVASVPFARFGVGAAITATSRQLGAVLGVAMLIAVVGTPAPADALGAFQSGWALAALAGLGAALAAAALGRVTVSVEALPASAAQPARG